MSYKLGFIGCGNMGSAMIGGVVKANIVAPSGIMGCDKCEKNLETLKQKYYIHTSNSNLDAANFSDILVLSVKPNFYEDVITEIKNATKKDAIIVTIAPGITIEKTQSLFGTKIKVVRVMPNTPALVGEGMSALCKSSEVTDDDLKSVIELLGSFSKTEIVEEKLMDVVTAISGSSPAYVYMFIEALADGAVLKGMPRDKAYKIAAQAVLGSAKMVLETGMHPGALKDNVCSPGGTTIAAVYSLEKNNFRGSVIEAVDVCTEVSKGMGKK